MHAQLVEVRFPASGVRAKLALEATSTTRLGKAWLTTPRRTPCTDGAPATELTVDGKAQTTLVAGHHVLELLVVEAPASLRGDRMLDIQVQSGTANDCLRIPILSRVVAYERQSLPFLTGAVQIEAFAPHDERALVGFGLGAGYAAGRFRGEATLGAGVALCEKSACGAETGGGAKGALALPGSVAVKAYPWTWRPAPSSWGLGFGARYSVVYSHVPALNGEYDLVSHGAHALLLVALSDPIPPGVADRTVSVQTIEYEIPVGVWVATHEGRTETRFSAGVAVRLDFVP